MISAWPYSHTANRKRVHQGMDPLCLTSLKQLVFNQTSRLSAKELTWGGGTSSFLHRSQANTHSQRRCTMDSSSVLHIGQTLSQLIPLATNTSFTGMLPCKHNQRKFVILGKMSNFQIHCAWNYVIVSSPWFASQYAELVVNSPFLENFHITISLPLPYNWIGVALILSLMNSGRSNEISSHFHSWPNANLKPSSFALST